MRERGLVIAIDGTSGSGKSTAGRALAERLGYTFIDTGAMYRALALKALRSHVFLDSEADILAVAVGSRIELVAGGRGVELDGKDVTHEIRSREVAAASSRVSVHPGVRRGMVARQRELGQGGGVVLDGRDIGTAVFPDAEVKFYVDADPASRAQRRHGELEAQGAAADVQTIARDLHTRDLADTTRADSPLVRAPDAVLIDTTSLIPAEVVERMLAVVTERMPGAASGRRRR